LRINEYIDVLSEVWSFETSAAMRDSEGGVSERSLLEQVTKMRLYLRENEI